MSDNDEFEQAATWLSSAPAAANLPNETKLQIYGLYKFAKTGAGPDTSRPSIFSPAPRAKYDAWVEQARQHNVTSAKNRYVDIARDVGWSGAGAKDDNLGGGIRVSTMTAEEQASESRLHNAVLDGDIELVKEALQTTDINAKDEYGLTPLHLAADRGHESMARFLLAAGGDKHAKDEDGQTPLMLAEAAGRHEVVDILK